MTAGQIANILGIDEVQINYRLVEDMSNDFFEAKWCYQSNPLPELELVKCKGDFELFHSKYGSHWPKGITFTDDKNTNYEENMIKNEFPEKHINVIKRVLNQV